MHLLFESSYLLKVWTCVHPPLAVLSTIHPQSDNSEELSQPFGAVALLNQSSRTLSLQPDINGWSHCKGNIARIFLRRHLFFPAACLISGVTHGNTYSRWTSTVVHRRVTNLENALVFLIFAFCLLNNEKFVLERYPPSLLADFY